MNNEIHRELTLILPYITVLIMNLKTIKIRIDYDRRQ